MKILHVIPNLYMGGAEKFCVDLINNLSRNHDVTLFVLHKVNKDSILYKRINENIKVVSFQKKLGLDISLFFKLKNSIQQEKPDVINTHLSGLFYSSLFIKFNKSIQVFHTVHSEAKKEAPKFKKIIYNHLYKYKKVIPIGISKLNAKSIEEEYNLKEINIIDNGSYPLVTTEKLKEVKNEIEKLKTRNNQKVIICVGRISPEKNQQLLINSVKNIENVILIIVGEADATNTNLLKELKKISHNTFFLGLKDNVADYVYCSDIFALSSLYEGLPMTLIEAMSLGKICVSTPVGGIPDVIEDKKNGFLTINMSLENYIAKINEILHLSENNINLIKENAFQTYESKYSITNTSKKYLDLYSRKDIK